MIICDARVLLNPENSGNTNKAVTNPISGCQGQVKGSRLAKKYDTDPVETGRKLIVLRTFNLRPVSMEDLSGNTSYTICRCRYMLSK